MLKSTRTAVIFLFTLAFFVLAPLGVEAASLRVSSSQTTVSAGNIFSVRVSVSADGRAINSADGIVQFPTDLLEVMSVNKNSSIFSLWVEDPKFSNFNGSISFNGGVPNPGFSGQNGEVITVVFRAKKAGTASILFSDSSVRANDGLGTNVLTTKSGATITIQSTVEVVKPTVTPQPPVASNSDKALVVTSSTHPQQKTWYNSSTATFKWSLPSNALAVRTAFNARLDSDTSVLYDSVISERTIDDIEDGKWYFHVNYRTDKGWSPVAHYAVQVDTVNPKNLTVTAKEGERGGAFVTLSAEDELSGIDHYIITVDNGEPLVVSAEEAEGSVFIPLDRTGDHKIVVKVYDRAGNVAEAATSVTTSVASQVTIDSFTSSIKVGESVEMSGTAPYENAQLSILVRSSDDEVLTHIISSDSTGGYRFVSQPIDKRGTYTVRVDLIHRSGAVSLSSREVSFEATKPIILQIGTYTTELLTVLIPTVAMLFALLFLLYFGWHKFFGLREKRKAEFKQIEERVHHSLKVLSEEVTKQVMSVEKTGTNRSVSPGEKKAIQELKKAIADIDKYIENQIEKIEKDSVKK